ncbi:MAG: hypothetical protein ACRC6X_03585 [Culicoidibacterales bacterium]
MPKLDQFAGYEIPDDAHKVMPLRNIIIMFHQEFTSLWSKTILSNFECDSFYEWVEHWFSIRSMIVELLKKINLYIYKVLEQKPRGKLGEQINILRDTINKKKIRTYKMPYEDRPFEKKGNLPDGLIRVKIDFFQSIENFYNQVVGFLSGDTEQSRLALINLRQTLSNLKKMQTFFNEICIEQQILIESHQKLCLSEEKIYQQLMISCMYFSEHKPRKHFNRYQIGIWYENNYKDKLKRASETLDELSLVFSVEFPVSYFFDGILSNYPIVINNFEITNDEANSKLLYLCTSFIELDYDYMIILFSNEPNVLSLNGVIFSKNFLEQIKQAIENEDVSQISKLSPPFTIEVTTQMLNCFSKKYNLVNQIATENEEILCIGEILWALSKCRQVLVHSEDIEYSNILLKEYKDELLKKLEFLHNKIQEDHYVEIYNTCNSILEGNQFLDLHLNEFLLK